MAAVAAEDACDPSPSPRKAPASIQPLQLHEQREEQRRAEPPEDDSVPSWLPGGGGGGEMPKEWEEDASFLASFDKPGGYGPNYPWRPLRCATSLKAPYNALVSFLAQGYGYDNHSLGVAVGFVNDNFEARRLQEALEMAAIAYEIARLHFDYRPLLFDLVIRRVLCLSMLGEIDQGFSETALAEQIVPCTAIVQFVLALLSAKAGKSEAAFAHLQRASEIEEDSVNFVQCFVAWLTMRKGDRKKDDFNQAVDISSKVLQRSPGYPFALLVRHDAYRFHPSNVHQHAANQDFAALMAIDSSLQAWAGQPPGAAEPSLLDEVFLRFHPYLHAQGPRPYEEYPMYRYYVKRQHFSLTCLIVIFFAKVKVAWKSRRATNQIVQATQELLEKRAETEHKLWELLGTYKTLSSVESSKTEVWGPADPDNRTNKYRRYWMEKPLSFPLRNDGSGVTPLQCGCPERSRSASPHSASGQLVRSEDTPQTRRANWAVEQARLLAEAQNAGSPDGANRPEQHQLRLPMWEGMSPEHERLHNRITSHGVIGPGSQRSLGLGGAIAETKRLAGIAVAQAPRGLELPLHQGKTGGTQTPGSTSFGGSEPLGSLPRTRPDSADSQRSSPAMSPHSTFRGTAPLAFTATVKPGTSWQNALASQQVLSDAVEAARLDCEAAARYAESLVPPFERAGDNWDQERWLEQADKLLHEIGSGQLAILAELPSPPERPPLPASTAAVTDHQDCQVNLSVAINDAGWGVIPDWYPSLDRIYEITDMVNRTAVEDPMVPYGCSAPSRSKSKDKSLSPRSRRTPRLGRARPGQGGACASPAPASGDGGLPKASHVSALRGKWSRDEKVSMSIPVTPQGRLHEWHRQEVLARRQELDRRRGPEDPQLHQQKEQRREVYRQRQKQKLAEWADKRLERTA